MTDDMGQMLGRVLVLRVSGPFDGNGAAPPERVATRAKREGARFLLVDATGAPYIDSGGLRWLLALRQAAQAGGQRLRIAARRAGPIWRNLMLLGIPLELYGSPRRAWRAPHHPITPREDGQ